MGNSIPIPKGISEVKMSLRVNKSREKSLWRTHHNNGNCAPREHWELLQKGGPRGLTRDICATDVLMEKLPRWILNGKHSIRKGVHNACMWLKKYAYILIFSARSKGYNFLWLWRLKERPTPHNWRFYPFETRLKIMVTLWVAGHFRLGLNDQHIWYCLNHVILISYINAIWTKFVHYTLCLMLFTS